MAAAAVDSGQILESVAPWDAVAAVAVVAAVAAAAVVDAPLLHLG